MHRALHSPICPECGQDAPAARAAALRESKLARRLPWIAVAFILALQVIHAVLPRPFGVGFFAGPPFPRNDFPHFVGTQRGYTLADLHALASAPSPGDRLLRDLLREGHRYVYLENEDALEACFDQPQGRQLRIVTRGWPVRWRNQNTDRHTDDVYRDQHTLGAGFHDGVPWQIAEPRSWRVRIASRSADDSFQRDLIITSLRLTLAVAAALFAWLLVRAVHRARPMLSRIGHLGLWTSALALSLFGAAAFATLAGRIGEDRLTVIPDDAVARSWAPLGLTAGDLRAMLGRPDADTRLAASILAAAPIAPPDGSVLLARRVIAEPFQVSMLEIGWPNRVMTITRAWKTDPVQPGIRPPLKADAGRLRAQTGALSWDLPRWKGARSGLSLSVEPGELTFWLLALAVLFALTRLLVRAWVGLRLRRRSRARRCPGCGYDLQGMRHTSPPSAP